MEGIKHIHELRSLMDIGIVHFDLTHIAISGVVIDFIVKCLQINESLRINMKGILAHPLITANSYAELAQYNVTGRVVEINLHLQHEYQYRIK
jgi:serine/threonine protein kinase